MRLIERLHYYLEHKQITAYLFEKTCGLSNGYLGKQLRGKGSVGSEILEKIGEQYPDLNLTWLITGKGKMIQSAGKGRPDEKWSMAEEDAVVYHVRKKVIETLYAQIAILEESIQKKKKRKRRSGDS